MHPDQTVVPGLWSVRVELTVEEMRVIAETGEGRNQFWERLREVCAETVAGIEDSGA